ncbi:MAG: ABC transporter permease [Planctomycetota bacterium]
MISLFFRTMQLGFKSLLLHKLRAALAMTGILIGVTAVIWLVALGEGVSEQAQRQIQQLGARNVIVKSVKPANTEGGEGGFIAIYGLTTEDFDRVQTIEMVQRAVPMREIAREARHADQLLEVQLIGCTPAYSEINHLGMWQGRFIEARDQDEKANVCVLASHSADKLFPLENPLGKRIQIDSDFYTVIGVTEERSASASIGSSLLGREYNKDIYIPFDTFRARLGDEIITASSGTRSGELVEISQITVTVDEIDDVEETAAIIGIQLEKFHKQEDYTIVVPKELLRQARMLRSLFNALLVLIAGISLIVGGIGIMNIMLATVTERTREIGVRRALGAKRSDIITQFLAETIVLTGLGGLLGVGVGFLCGPSVSAALSGVETFLPDVWNSLPPTIRDLKPIIATWSVLAAFVISVGVGVLFGIYPARRAALMDPIEALRHE